MSNKKIKNWTDQEVVDFCNAYRADGNVKWDLRRHKKMLKNKEYTEKKSKKVYTAWVKRLSKLVKSGNLSPFNHDVKSNQ